MSVEEYDYDEFGDEYNEFQSDEDSCFMRKDEQDMTEDDWERFNNWMEWKDYD